MLICHNDKVHRLSDTKSKKKERQRVKDVENTDFYSLLNSAGSSTVTMVAMKLLMVFSGDSEVKSTMGVWAMVLREVSHLELCLDQIGNLKVDHLSLNNEDDVGIN